MVISTITLLFTFHYVSISTSILMSCPQIKILIYIPLCIYFNTWRKMNERTGYQFTFHYVSISTYPLSNLTVDHIHLHSTMYLFQQEHVRTLGDGLCCIYIPLCIYFNETSTFLVTFLTLFTFHYVSISTK
mgnify:CR=1 FL=1